MTAPKERAGAAEVERITGFSRRKTAAAPRLIPAAQLRARLGCDGAQLRRLRKRGILPGPLPGTRLYDMRAVERALDGPSDSKARLSLVEQRLLERARRWGRSR